MEKMEGGKSRPMKSVEMENGKKQFIKDLTVNEVKADFSLIDATEAIAEVKKQPRKRDVTTMPSPKNSWGALDGILGIQYNLIQPIPIHTLSSGLTLYISKLKGYKAGYNAMIGGPRESFRCLSKRTGNVETLITIFVPESGHLRILL